MTLLAAFHHEVIGFALECLVVTASGSVTMHPIHGWAHKIQEC